MGAALKKLQRGKAAVADEINYSFYRDYADALAPMPIALLNSNYKLFTNILSFRDVIAYRSARSSWYCTAAVDPSSLDIF